MHNVWDHVCAWFLFNSIAMVDLIEHNKNLIGILHPYPGHTTFFNDREAITLPNAKQFGDVGKWLKKGKKTEKWKKRLFEGDREKQENLNMHLHTYISCLFSSLFIYSNVIETCAKGDMGIRCARRMSTRRHWGIRLLVSHTANLRLYKLLPCYHIKLAVNGSTNFSRYFSLIVLI